jgi:hypothetical protein
MNNNEQEWQDAIAGIINNSNQSAEQIEAKALRQALLVRRDSIERESAKFDRIQFEKMKNVLQKEGHLGPDVRTKSFLRKQISLIGSFAAGSISASLLILGLTSQVMTTRGSEESNFLNNANEVIDKWKNSSQSNEPKLLNTKSITLIDSDPIALIHTLEEKAWEIGLQTTAYSKNGAMHLSIKNIHVNDIRASELKLILGIHPSINGDVEVTIYAR